MRSEVPWSLTRTSTQYGLVAELGDQQSSLEDTMKGARLVVMRWVYQSVGIVAPRFIDLEQSFENNDRPGVKYGLATHGSSWVAKMERADESSNGRYWTTEINVTAAGDSAWLAVRNMCTSAPSVTADVPISTPRFVRFFSRHIGLLDMDIAIDEEPWTIQDEQDLDDLAELLTCSERFLPVVVVTEPYVLDISAFAKRAVGVAHVVALPDRFTHRLTETLGKEWSAFHGAVRTYNPGLDLAVESPFDHPLALRARVINFSAPDGGGGPDEFANYALRRAQAAGAARVSRDVRFPRFSAVRALSLNNARLAVKSEDVAPLLLIADEEVSQARQLEKMALEENDRLQREMKQIHAEMRGMQARIEHLLGAMKLAGRPERVIIPEKLEDLRTWAEQYLAGRVYLMPRAYRGAKGSQYENSSHIYQALLWLATDYFDGKNAEDDEDPRRLQMRLKLDELEMSYEGSIQKENAGDEYFVEYGGTRRFLNMAIKKGNSREPRYCMRIYTFWDDASQQTIVGSMPFHLDNTMS